MYKAFTTDLPLTTGVVSVSAIPVQSGSRIAKYEHKFAVHQYEADRTSITPPSSAQDNETLLLSQAYSSVL